MGSKLLPDCLEHRFGERVDPVETGEMAGP
jgi:hypothetical protein